MQATFYLLDRTYHIHIWKLPSTITVWASGHWAAVGVKGLAQGHHRIINKGAANAFSLVPQRFLSTSLGIEALELQTYLDSTLRCFIAVRTQMSEAVGLICCKQNTVISAASFLCHLVPCLKQSVSIKWEHVWRGQSPDVCYMCERVTSKMSEPDSTDIVQTAYELNVISNI